MKEGEEKKLQCPLCGNIFIKDLKTCPQGCPLSRGCGMVSCPRCHYHFVEESKIVKLFKKILARDRRTNDGNR
jgi:hypothetical protein